MSLTHSYAKLAQLDISAFESHKGVSLPSTYRTFLLTSNGGRPEDKNVLDVPGWRHKNTVISFFFGINTSDVYDLSQNLDRYEGRIPSDCIAIGDDVAGNLVCLRVKGEDAGKIFFWDHENEADDPDSRINVYPVADDIWDLVRKLRSEV